MRKRKLGSEHEEENLNETIKELELKLNKKRDELSRTRQQLRHAKYTIKRMKGIISYQRGRIITLYGPMGERLSEKGGELGRMTVNNQDAD